eukprot:8108537-Lingulodinium_polyedra.AAC.1
MRQWAQSAASLQGVPQRDAGTPSEQRAGADALKETAGVAPAGVTAELATWLVARIREGLGTGAKRWQWTLTMAC